MSVIISVVNHNIEFGGETTNGNVTRHPGQPIDFESDTPFAIFFKASARWPSRRPRRPFNLTLLINSPSPDDSNDVVMCSKFRNGKHRLKVNLKGTLHVGAIYWYGVAAFDPPLNIATVDPQIIIN